jgi:hypothetical protein
MGWWATGEDEDIIGDPPADTLDFTLKAIAEHYEYLQQPKPTLQQVLNAIASVLRMKNRRFSRRRTLNFDIFA